MSYNLLAGNTAYVVSDGKNILIGETEGISPITLNSSLGFGMGYDLSKKISFNLEPEN